LGWILQFRHWGAWPKTKNPKHQQITQIHADKGKDSEKGEGRREKGERRGKREEGSVKELIAHSLMVKWSSGQVVEWLSRKIVKWLNGKERS
jgi:hypothetical protein